MKHRPRAILLLLLMGSATSLALAAGLSSMETLQLKVGRQDIDQQSKILWQRFGPFCEIAEWHPEVLSCTEGKEGGATFRTLSLKDGSKIKERLLSSTPLSYDYAIVDSLLPVKNYHATFSIASKGEELDIVWSASYDAADGKSDSEARAAIDGVLREGMASISSKLSDLNLKITPARASSQ